jgi:hypothetical protein
VNGENGSLPFGSLSASANDSLFFWAGFSGEELKGGKHQAASPSSWSNDGAPVPVPPVNPWLTLSDNGPLATDDFGLHVKVGN